MPYDMLAKPDAEMLREAVLRHLKYSLGKDVEHASTYDWRVSLSLALRDLIVDPWFESTRKTYAAQSKRVYYLFNGIFDWASRRRRGNQSRC